MVPIAPSSTRMRSAAILRSRCSVGENLESASDIGLSFLLGGIRARLQVEVLVGPQSQQMAYGVDQIGPVHGVEVEIGDAAIKQIDHLLCRDRGGDQLAGRGVVLQALEALAQP